MGWPGWPRRRPWRAGPGRAVRVPCARHLRTAPCVTVSAGDSLEGGHSLQPLHTHTHPRAHTHIHTHTHAAVLRGASQNGGAHGACGGRSPAPFCCEEARDLSTWDTSARRGRLEMESPRAEGNGTLGDRAEHHDDGVADSRQRPGALSSSSSSEAAGGMMVAEGRQRRAAAPGRRGGDPEGRGPGGCGAEVRGGGPGSAESPRRQRRPRRPG